MSGSLLDSKPFFAARALEIGLTQAELDIMKAKNWGTFGGLAFSCAYKPNAPDETPLLRMAATVTASGAQDPPEERLPIIRRLFFEAYAMASADMRARVEAKDDDVPRRLALPERNHRSQEQEKRQTGISFTNHLEVIHALTDLISRMHDQNGLEYVRWEVCTTRDQEIMGIKTDPLWRPDSQGVVRETRVQKEIAADYSTDLLLKYTLQRRSLAFDSNRLSTYEAWDQWSEIMLDAYLQKPPTGYRAVTIEQLQKADLAMFKMLMKMTKSGIRPDAEGKFPLDEAISKAKDMPGVTLHLQPLQGELASGSKRGRDESRPEDEKVKKLMATVDNLKGELANLKKKASRSPPKKNKWSNRQDDKGEAKPKGNGKGSSFRMPRALIGNVAVNDDGEPICFDYNLDGCTKARSGEKCKKGWHVCCKPGCFKPHPVKGH